MSHVTITSFASPPANLTISESINDSTTVSTIAANISIVTIDQGSVGAPGPPGPMGPPGTGVSFVTNYSDNRLLTSDGTNSGIYAESNLTFDGSLLNIIGSGNFASGLYVNSIPVSISGHTHNYSPLFDQNLNTTDNVEFNNITANNILYFKEGEYIETYNGANLKGQFVFKLNDGTNILELENYIKLYYNLKFPDNTTQTTAWTGSILSSQVSDFNSATSGLLPVIDILPGSGISVSNSSGNYTISLSNSALPIPSNGRLTLQTGDPIYYNDISGSILYFTPYLGSYIGLYDTINSQWKSFYFTEISLSLIGMTNNTNYDIFLFDNSGTLTLERVVWSNNSTRSVNLTYQDGILVRNGSINKRYIGTIRSTSTSTTEDSISRRFVYNHNNQILKPLNISDSVSHTYSTSLARPYRNITTVGTTRVELVTGQNIFTNIICNSNFTTQSNSSSVGVSVDSTGIFNTKAVNTTTITSGALSSTMVDNSIDNVGISTGYHYIQLLESGSSVSTFNSASFRVLLSC